jgi:long-chain acyl-CoA synthetase
MVTNEVHLEWDVPFRRLEHWAAQRPDDPALHRRTAEGWDPVTWSQYAAHARAAGAALTAWGLEPGQCAVILADNRAEWLYLQWGIMMAGGIVAPSYASNTAEQVAYLVGHCQAPIVFADSPAQLAKLASVRDQLPALRQVVALDDPEGAEGVMSWASFLALEQPDHRAELDARSAAVEPADDAFIIYTSGTTGVPKAVMISHLNMAVQGEAMVARYPTERTRSICYLPLCHIAEQGATNLCQLDTGGEVFLCPEIAMMPKLLPEVRPNVLFGVPRVWEKVQAVLEGKFEQAPPMKRKLIRWALGVETRAFEAELAGEGPQGGLARWIARKLVVDKVRTQLGLADVLHTLTGAAPSNPDTLRFFSGLGFHVHEVYGLSETTGILTATKPGEQAMGTVGKPLEGVEVAIAEDGEILARGACLSRGYLHDPDATAELIHGGWLHTGDTGAWDEHGNLRIIGRIKDIIVTAGAKNVAPLPIEAKLKAIPGISQAVVVGDRRPYLVALLTVDPEHAGASVDDPAFAEQVEQRIQAINADLARYESIKRFELLPSEFSIEGGELTPTMKIKRSVVYEKYTDVIEAIYARPR